MSARAKGEYVRALYHRWRPEKRRIVDEFGRVAGAHRKQAIRLLNGPAAGTPRPRHLETRPRGSRSSRRRGRSGRRPGRRVAEGAAAVVDKGSEFISQHLREYCRPRTVVGIRQRADALERPKSIPMRSSGRRSRPSWPMVTRITSTTV